VRIIPVYTFDGNMHTLVKIEKHGGTWCVYRLEKVLVETHTRARKMNRLRFIFEKRPFEKWSYKPYEDKDVSKYPQDFVEDVKCWQPHIILHT